MSGLQKISCISLITYYLLPSTYYIWCCKISPLVGLGHIKGSSSTRKVQIFNNFRPNFEQIQVGLSVNISHFIALQCSKLTIKHLKIPFDFWAMPGPRPPAKQAVVFITFYKNMGFQKIICRIYE